MKKNPFSSDGMWKGATPEIFFNAKVLRQHATAAEEVLWAELRNNKLEGHKFRRQHPLHVYVADFYCHKLKLVIEIDGGYHQTDEQKMLDAERTQALELQGLRLIRFSNEEVLSRVSEVLSRIKEFFPAP
ncbi:endonuclease domain-containing protein [Flavobacterium limnophilum]|uniref:endonuclease domain-containing protein n=1 Tax=Flavobacterium limnophilum TaxID=3003262 RepID=UPI002482903F|nr:endonuclease domain-containing protein [Flavobacterium limnophilum]